MAEKIVNVVWHGSQGPVRQAAGTYQEEINETARQAENMNDVLLRIMGRLRGDTIRELNFWGLEMFRVMAQGPQAFPDTLTMWARQFARTGQRTINFFRCDGLTDRQAVLQLITPLASFFRPVTIAVANSSGTLVLHTFR